jgi:hypothetical protein
MEPRREEREERKDRESRADANEAKPRRFRIVKLEERIAPGKPGPTNHPYCPLHTDQGHNCC